MNTDPCMELVGKTISFSEISKVLFPLNLLMNHCTKAVCWSLTSPITKQPCRYTRDSLMSSYEIRKQYAIPCMKTLQGDGYVYSTICVYGSRWSEIYWRTRRKPLSLTPPMNSSYCSTLLRASGSKEIL